MLELKKTSLYGGLLTRFFCRRSQVSMWLLLAVAKHKTRKTDGG